MILICLFLSIQVFAADDVKRTKAMSAYPDVQAFAKEIAAKNKLDEASILKAFDKSFFDYSIIDLLKTPAETKSWSWYSQTIVSEERIKNGRKYLETHRASLALAHKHWGVPQNLITAIIGIESTYGTYPFKRNAVTSLGTIAFEYPRRAKYFQSELESLFIFAAKDKTDPLTIKGSYAGAIGIPQFMPSNILQYGKDGDADGHIDLVGSHADAIESIAYYIFRHGWQEGKAMATLAKLTKTLPDSAFGNEPCNIKNYKTIRELKGLGVEFDNSYPDNTYAMLSRLDEDKGYTTIVFFENSCPIHKYNRSLKYTAAISLLANELVK